MSNDVAATREDTELVDPGYEMAVEHKAVLIERQAAMMKYLHTRLWSVDRKAHSARRRGESDAIYQESAREIEDIIRFWGDLMNEPLARPAEGATP